MMLRKVGKEKELAKEKVQKCDVKIRLVVIGHLWPFFWALFMNFCCEVRGDLLLVSTREKQKGKSE